MREKKRRMRKHKGDGYGYCKRCRAKENAVSKARYLYNFLLFSIPVTTERMSSKTVITPSI